MLLEERIRFVVPNGSNSPFLMQRRCLNAMPCMPFHGEGKEEKVPHPRRSIFSAPLTGRQKWLLTMGRKGFPWKGCS